MATTFLPTNLALLLLDFVALSFMTGAGATWRDKPAFNTLVIATLLLLSTRFGVAAYTELWPGRGTRARFRDMIMTHILGVYALCFLFLLGVILGARDLSTGEQLEKFHNTLYYLMCVGMVLGIVITAVHSLRHVSPRADGRLGTAVERTLPTLLPAYGVIPDNKLRQVAEHVFLGEDRFRRLLDSVDPHWVSPYRLHQSVVHTYRDVETQAFIMAHHAGRSIDIELRAMWVYLAHWLDDLFDDQYAPILANMGLRGDFDIREALRTLDENLCTLWDRGVALTQQISQAHWDTDLFTTGFRRLMMSGPMFSARCFRQHGSVAKAHEDLIVQKLTADYGVQELVQSVIEKDRRYLMYTSKVVVEIWDSFSEGANLNLSVLMNLFYAPGLFYHDAEAEYKREELVLRSKEDNPSRLGESLDRVFECILRLQAEQQKLALRPVRMFVRSFERVLLEKGLRERYEGFLADERIKGAMLS